MCGKEEKKGKGKEEKKIGNQIAKQKSMRNFFLCAVVIFGSIRNTLLG